MFFAVGRVLMQERTMARALVLCRGARSVRVSRWWSVDVLMTWAAG